MEDKYAEILTQKWANWLHLINIQYYVVAHSLDIDSATQKALEMGLKLKEYSDNKGEELL